MKWFNKKEEKKEEIPKLPELPELPNINQINSQKLSKLPSFPNNSLGKKFSQNTIKEAVTGKKEGVEGFNVNEFEKEEQMIQEPSEEYQEIKPKKIKEIPEHFKVAARRVKETEPIFIRLDKFEESLNILEKTKKQILEIGEMLKNIKRIKEEEEKELEFWENEIQLIKKQIEKVDNEIFSKIE